MINLFFKEHPPGSCLLLLSVLLFLPLCLFGQRCTHVLEGSLKDAINSEALPGGTIQVLEINRVITTDEEGTFSLQHLCPQVYTLHISFVGYAPLESKIDLRSDKQIDLKLQPSVKVLTEASVTGLKEINTPLLQQYTLAQQELELTRGQSLGEALQNIPGLSMLQTGPSIAKPVIHGMHSNRVLIYNAGVRQEGQQWGSEHAPEVDPYIATSISVIKGAASVMYGPDALGGVVMVEPAPLDYRPGLRGKIESTLMSNNGMAAVAVSTEGASPNSLFSYRAQVTSRRAGNARTPGYYLGNTGFRELNGALMLGFAKNRFSTQVYTSTFNSKLGIYQGAHIGNTTDLLAAINRQEPLVKGVFSYNVGRPYQLINHHTLKSLTIYKVGASSTLNLQYSLQQNNREEYDMVRQAHENTYQLKFDLTTQVLDLHLEHGSFLNIRGKLGVNGQFQQNFYDGRYLIPFFKSYNTGVYLIERWIYRKWELEGGLRYDYKYMRARLREVPTDRNSPEIRPDFTFGQLTGTVGASYTLYPGWQLNAGLAKGWRPPSINELFSQGVHHGSARYELGDRNLKEESTINFQGGITKSKGRLTADLGLYYNTIQNYIYLRPGNEAILTIRGAFLAYHYVQVNAEFYGADATINYKIGNNISTALKYSAVRAYNLDGGQHLEFIPPDRLTGIITFQLPEKGRLTENALSFNAAYTARQWRVKDTQDYAPTPNAYTLFNIDASTRCKISSRHITLSLSGYNLLNTRYRSYMNAFRYFADDTGRNVALRISVPI